MYIYKYIPYIHSPNIYPNLYVQIISMFSFLRCFFFQLQHMYPLEPLKNHTETRTVWTLCNGCFIGFLRFMVPFLGTVGHPQVVVKPMGVPTPEPTNGVIYFFGGAYKKWPKRNGSLGFFL